MKKILYLSALLVLAAGCDLSSSGPRITAYPHPQKALLVMDIQKDFVGKGARMPVDPAQIEPMITAVNTLSAAEAAAGRPVIVIRNAFPKMDPGNLFRNNAAVEGSPGAELDPRVNRVPGLEFTKNQPDAFSNPAFEGYLIDHQINELVLTGVFGDQCVYWTARAALKRGYLVTYVANAVASGSQAAVDQASADLVKRGAQVTQAPVW